MPIATSLCAAVLLAAALPGATLPLPPPALTVAVDVAPAIPSDLVAYVLDETAEIWRDAGLQLNWDRHDATMRASDHRLEHGSARSAPSDGPPCVTPAHSALLAGLRVTVGVERGNPEKDAHVLPLGWIVFEAGSPLQEIHLSFANAADLLTASDLVVGRIATLTIKERYVLLGRAMGRALAHEIGHYLLASKTHSPTGLMQARRNAAELFSSSRRGFRVEAEQRQLIAARLEALVALSD
jgi:hypothetical protein